MNSKEDSHGNYSNRRAIEKEKTGMLKAISANRWRATAAERRLHGGSTVTEFYIDHPTDPTKNGKFIGYGKTPGERKTYAINQAKRQWGLT